MKSKINGYLLTWFISIVLAFGVAYGTITVKLDSVYSDYIPRPEMEQIVKRLDSAIDRLNDEINRLYELGK